jgi:hypothetical protein
MNIEPRMGQMATGQGTGTSRPRPRQGEEGSDREGDADARAERDRKMADTDQEETQAHQPRRGDPPEDGVDSRQRQKHEEAHPEGHRQEGVDQKADQGNHGQAQERVALDRKLADHQHQQSELERHQQDPRDVELAKPGQRERGEGSGLAHRRPPRERDRTSRSRLSFVIRSAPQTQGA